MVGGPRRHHGPGALDPERRQDLCGGGRHRGRRHRHRAPGHHPVREDADRRHELPHVELLCRCGRPRRDPDRQHGPGAVREGLPHRQPARAGQPAGAVGIRAVQERLRRRQRLHRRLGRQSGDQQRGRPVPVSEHGLRGEGEWRRGQGVAGDGRQALQPDRPGAGHGPAAHQQLPGLQLRHVHLGGHAVRDRRHPAGGQPHQEPDLPGRAGHGGHVVHRRDEQLPRQRRRQLPGAGRHEDRVRLAGRQPRRADRLYQERGECDACGARRRA
ncbi:hypothetical protein D3C87_1283940 [compost metagenome]